MIPDGEGAQGTRLQTLIAHAGEASRRAAEDLIRAGRVQVNGVVVTELGSRALPTDTVTLDGKPIRAESVKRYLALNKPPGYLCAMADDRGRPLAVELLRPKIQERVYNVGRLDMESCGLILFTNDGEFAAKAGHPSFGIIKEYQVETDRSVSDEFVSRFMSGIDVVDEAGEPEVLRAVDVKKIAARRLVIRLAEGKNREIRRALAAFSMRARVLRRVSIGPILLGDLPEGRYRALSKAELAAVNAVFDTRGNDT